MKRWQVALVLLALVVAFCIVGTVDYNALVGQ